MKFFSFFINSLFDFTIFFLVCLSYLLSTAVMKLIPGYVNVLALVWPTNVCKSSDLCENTRVYSNTQLIITARLFLL